MKNPFEFGKVILSKQFVNRKDDINRLNQNIENRINTILISPRRWGKTSLVRKVADIHRNSRKYKFCFVDMFNVNNENDFYNIFAAEVIKSTSNKFDEWVKMSQKFLSSYIPKISFGTDPVNDFSIQLERKDRADSFLDILNLPEKIATQKGVLIVICLDEFQNIQKFPDTNLFQQRLRSAVQHQKNVVYVFYGSKRNMLSTLFEDASMPFYRFGDNFYLEKIDGKHFQAFICKSFNATGKSINRSMAVRITDLMEDHPYYIQQFAYILWNNTDDSVDEEIFKYSVNDLIFRNSLLFEREFEGLSKSQINFIKLLVSGINENYFSGKNINKFNLGSSSNVQRVIKSLEKKEIIDRFTSKIEFIDPVFRLWLKIIVFKI